MSEARSRSATECEGYFCTNNTPFHAGSKIVRWMLAVEFGWRIVTMRSGHILRLCPKCLERLAGLDTTIESPYRAAVGAAKARR